MSAPKTLLRILVPIAIVALAAMAAKAIVESREAPAPSAPEAVVPLVRTVDMTTASVSLSVEAQGSVLPRTQTTLKAEVAARIVRIAEGFASGGFFDEGEVLLELDATDFEANRQEALAGLRRAEARLAQEEADAEIALRDWVQTRGNVEPPALVAREPQLAEARAEVAAAKAMLEKAQRDVARTIVRAPYAGRVRTRDVDLGQFVDRGATLASIYAVDYAEVRLPVPDRDLALLDLPLGRRAGSAPGPEVVLTAEFGRELHRWQGRVVRTEGAIDPQTRSVILVARVDDPYALGDAAQRPPLLAGMFVQASISGRRLEDAISIPREALRSGERVFVLSADDTLSIRSVDIVTGDADRVVLRAGVAAGERVIVSPVELPVDGMRLRAASPDAPGGQRMAKQGESPR